MILSKMTLKNKNVSCFFYVIGLTRVMCMKKKEIVTTNLPPSRSEIGTIIDLLDYKSFEHGQAKNSLKTISVSQNTRHEFGT